MTHSDSLWLIIVTWSDLWKMTTLPPLSPVANNSPSWLNSTAEIISAEQIWWNNYYSLMTHQWLINDRQFTFGNVVVECSFNLAEIPGQVTTRGGHLTTIWILKWWLVRWMTQRDDSSDYSWFEHCYSYWFRLDNIPIWLNIGIHKAPINKAIIPIITPEDVGDSLLGAKFIKE